MQPVIIARNKPKGNLEFEFHQWDSVFVGDWKSVLNNAKAIVNLAGRSVDCIKSPDNCDTILRSRLNSTKTIGKAFSEVDHPPKTWIQMVTAHIYGDSPTEMITEESEHGYGFAPVVGKAWEEAYYKSKPKYVRGVVLRTSFVIGKNGGALASLKRIVRLGLGGTVGKGNQGMSWIHEFDMNEIIYQRSPAVTTKVHISQVPLIQFQIGNSCNPYETK